MCLCVYVCFVCLCVKNIFGPAISLFVATICYNTTMVAKQGQWAQQRMEGDNDRGRNWPYVDGRDMSHVS